MGKAAQTCVLILCCAMLIVDPVLAAGYQQWTQYACGYTIRDRYQSFTDYDIKVSNVGNLSTYDWVLGRTYKIQFWGLTAGSSWSGTPGVSFIYPDFWLESGSGNHRWDLPAFDGSISFLYYCDSLPSFSFGGTFQVARVYSGTYAAVPTYNISVEDVTDQVTSGEISNIDDNVSAIKDQNQQFRDEDRQDATTAGSDVTGAATDLNNIKSKWEILWYPIEFSNTVLGAFTGGSSNARYRSYYGNITGYTYDNDTGYLVPVYAPATRSGDYPESPGGTVITFPSYTLPVLNVKLWDSFSYDISTLKTQFPVVFNGIYVVVTILEVYWFVGFLRDKYEEVFG